MIDFFGGIESGGTKIRVIVANDPNNVFAESQFTTTAPVESLQKCIEFFNTTEEKIGNNIKAIGFGSFGPLDLDPLSPTFGYITGTPKPDWSNYDVLGFMKSNMNHPVFLETDVNCAALGERTWGAAQGLNDFVYITIGTGIGGGVFINGKPLHGLIHSELGHMFIPHDVNADAFTGCCQFHNDCMEGLASGPAIQARWGQPAEKLPKDHPAWDLEAKYISVFLANIILAMSPRRIILGGGVMQKEGLLKKIHQHLPGLLNNYVHSTWVIEKLTEYIVLPGLKDRSGVLGAIALARSHSV